MFAVSAVPALEQGLPPIGINRSGLSLQEEATQQQTLQNFTKLHATWFRDGPSSGSAQGIANFVAEIRLAKGQGLSVLVNIVQMDEDYDIPLFAHDHGWKAKKLSQINLEKFAQRCRRLFEALEAAGLTIDAVEFGNEDDSYYYDADVPNGHVASPDELHTWLRGYGEFLKTGAEVLHDPHFHPQSKIITFGIAHGCDQCGGPPQHLSNPAKVLAMLENVDGFNGQTLSQGLPEVINAFDDLSQRVPIGPMLFYSYNSGEDARKSEAAEPGADDRDWSIHTVISRRGSRTRKQPLV